MIIVIAGATGFIGKHLGTYLSGQGHRVVPVEREMFHENKQGALIRMLATCDVVINLTGASINRRWTAAYKKEIYASRVRLTRQLVQAMHSTTHKPQLFISASAVGYYPANDVFDEYSGAHGDNYLAALCHAWEREAMKCPAQTRLVILRLATVLSPDGGALQQLLRPLKYRLAAVIGPGTQPFAWVAMHDVCRVVEFVLAHREVVGAVNVVAPQQTTHKEFVRMLGRSYRCLCCITIPAFLFRWVYGEAAVFLTSGSYVTPRRLSEFGFEFALPGVSLWLNSIQQPSINTNINNVERKKQWITKLFINPNIDSLK